MEGSSLGKQGEGEGQVAKKSHKALQKFLQEAQIILDQNQLLINEVNKNHESANPEDLGRNCGLIRQLYDNLKRVTDLYGGVLTSLAGQSEATTSSGPTETLSDQ
ncbi:unnamed protein product [Spirodela intermedia]|uniref:Protein EARLY FLOWERING 4 domain-containing protein n=1 Tax=Spirodela intermedia TaxID=51605 RepID=A0A7I8KCF9_SPIIN|nr:unnamed protein product [Spirodela intermedia]